MTKKQSEISPEQITILVNINGKHHPICGKKEQVKLAQLMALKTIKSCDIDVFSGIEFVEKETRNRHFVLK